MNKEQARQQIINSADRFLERDGSGKGYICPICGSGSGKNGTGITAKDGIHFTCWTGCFTNADIIDIIGIRDGIEDYNGKLDRASQELGITIDKGYHSNPADDFKPEYQKQDKTERKSTTEPEPEADYTALFLQANQDIDKTDYHRGLSLETLNRFKIGFIENWTHPKAPNAPKSPRLIIPTSKGSYLARDTRADLTDTQKKYSKSKVGKTHIFNIEALATATQPVFIVEGEIDALSIIEVGGDAIGLGSVNMIKNLLGAVSQTPPSQPLIIALDKDTAGEKASQELTEGLKKLGISYTVSEDFNGYKDANEALQSDREAFTELVRDTREIAEDIAEIDREELIDELKKESVAYSLQSFKDDIKASEKVKYYPTGFNELDKILDGGLYPGLYIVGAISSLGKTTFCLQIADQVAQSGTDVLIFSLEMARNELIAKSISRLTYIHNSQENGDRSNAKTTRGILTGTRYQHYSPAEKDLIARSIEDYGYYSEHIYISEGVGDIGVEQIRERVVRHTRITGKRPVVLIDYLQILAPYEPRATDKQNTDKAVMELKRLSRDFDIPVIGVSSFNRSNYTEPVNLTSFKESGAIEYSSDVLIGLQYSGMDYKTVTKNHKDGTPYQALETDSERALRVSQLIDFQSKLGREGKAQEVQVKILKNRNGSKGDSKINFIPMFNYFYEPTDFDEVGDIGVEQWEPF